MRLALVMQFKNKILSRRLELKVTQENSRIWSRFRIRYSEVRIRGSGPVLKCHGSATPPGK
jgi:hypothetical protein